MAQCLWQAEELKLGGQNFHKKLLKYSSFNLVLALRIDPIILYALHDIVNTKAKTEQNGNIIKEDEENIIDNRNDRYCDWPKISRQ